MAGRLFGTDGIRGRVNGASMTAQTALRVGLAAGAHLRRRGRLGTVLVGKDTRRSGYMLENALVAGFTSIGMDVLLTGPLPTPAVAMLTRSMRADLGVMISASHNPHEDNGIKFFGPDGHKLSDGDEFAIEAALSREPALAEPSRIGRARRIDGAADRYVEFAKRAFPRGMSLSGLKVVVDAANGAAFRTAPTLIWELGAEVVEIGTRPDGFNINAGCGSTAPAACAAAVLEHGADLGIALDGDADRVHLIDEAGRVVDGDQVMALIAERAMARGELARATLVTTIMSNAGLALHLDARGIAVERTKVGDRHVMERMRVLGCNVGGEQSGHVILSDHATTGDGLVAALQALAAMIEGGRPASEVTRRFEPLPQRVRNVPAANAGLLLQSPALRSAIAAAEAELGAAGRLVVRPSGTEPVLRLMAEGPDPARLDALLRELAAEIEVAGAEDGPIAAARLAAPSDPLPSIQGA